MRIIKGRHGAKEQEHVLGELPRGGVRVAVHHVCRPVLYGLRNGLVDVDMGERKRRGGGVCRRRTKGRALVVRKEREAVSRRWENMDRAEMGHTTVELDGAKSVDWC